MPTIYNLVQANNLRKEKEISFKRLVYQFAKDCAARGQSEELILENLSTNGLLTDSNERLVASACEGIPFYIGYGITLQ